MSDTHSAVEVPLKSAAAPPSEPGLTMVGSGGGGLLAMIERLATNPNLNVEVFDRLLAARRSEEDRAAERAFNLAMSQAKGELQPVLKTRDVDYPSQAGTATRASNIKLREFRRRRAASSIPCSPRTASPTASRVEQAADMARVTCIVSHSRRLQRPRQA